MNAYLLILAAGLALAAVGVYVMIRLPQTAGGTFRAFGVEFQTQGAGVFVIALGFGAAILAAANLPPSERPPDAPATLTSAAEKPAPATVQPTTRPATYPDAQTCRTVPRDGAILDVWNSPSLLATRAKSQLGCPDGEAALLAGTIEEFDGGYLIWDNLRGSLTALYRDPTGNGGEWEEFEDKYRLGDAHPYVNPRRPTPRPDQATPEAGFGLLWHSEDRVFTNLGFPRGREVGFKGPSMHFLGGRVMYVSEPPVPPFRAVWILYDRVRGALGTWDRVLVDDGGRAILDPP